MAESRMSISPRIVPADRRAARTLGVAAAVLFAVSLALFWPGYVAYDSLAQYAQATSGHYEDWHPPIMARLWSLFGDRGPAPMLAVQLGAYWLGLGLFAAALAANMLGVSDAEADARTRRDALGEVANVVCGNVLPLVGGRHAVFHLGAPHAVALDALTAPDAPHGTSWESYREHLLVEAGRATSIR